jgi:ketosteroid isomerase-like protein
MSRANVEIVRQVIEANRSGDMEAAIEVAVGVSDPRIEFTSRMAAVQPETYRGHEGLRRYYSEMADSWEEWQNEVEEVLDVGRDRVVAVFRSRTVGKKSGAPAEVQRGAVFELSNGKLLRGQIYSGRQEALEAVGLRE